MGVSGLPVVGSPGLNVFRDDLAGDLAGLVERQVFSRPQRTTLPVIPGDDSPFVSTGLRPKQQTAYLRVPELVGAVLGLGCRDSALGEGGDRHPGGFRCWRKPMIGRAGGS